MDSKHRKDESSTLNLDTDNSGLRQKTLRSSLITFAAQPLKLFISIGSVIVLARLLTPEDFGVVAMVLPLMALAESVNGLGLGAAMVQRGHLDHEQANAIFWMSLIINSFMVFILVISTPLLVMFYQEVRLNLIIPAMALGMMGEFLSVHPRSLLVRQLKFGTLTSIRVTALLLGVVAALIAAVMSFGYWALAIQFVVERIVACMGCWLFCAWRPSKPIGLLQLGSQVKSMLSYGANLSSFHIINRISMEMDRVFVGFFNGASALGLYSLAYNWAYFPFNQIYLPLVGVANSSLSRAAVDADWYRRQTQEVLMLMFNLLFPVLGFLIVGGEAFMLVLLGEQWLESSGIFQILLMMVFINSFYRVTKWVYISSGQTNRQLKWSLIHTPLTVLAAALGAQWGPTGVAWAMTLSSLFLAYPAINFCLKYTSLSLRNFLSPVWKPAIASISAACALLLIQSLIAYSFTAFLELILNGVLYGLLYIAAFLLLPGGYAEIRLAITAMSKVISKRFGGVLASSNSQKK